MEANELRIGNYINNLNKVLSITDGCILCTGLSMTGVMFIENPKPIPLTEEWLLNLGFTKHHSEFYNDVLYLINVTDNLEFDWGVYPKQLGSGIQIKNSDKLKYVHQLQNIYFAITNKELTLKQQ